MYDVSMGEVGKGRGRDGGKSPERVEVVEAGLLQSFTSRDVEMWSRLLNTDSARSILQSPGSEFRRKLFSSLKSTDVEKIGLDELRAIVSMLTRLLDMGLYTEPRLKISLERCIVALQDRAPQDAVLLAHHALAGQVPCGGATILSTISKGIKFARNHGDLEQILHLTQCAFSNDALQGSDPKAAHVFNVILAVTCDPLVSRPGQSQRVGPHYQGDRCLLDVAHRMLIGSEFAQAVASGGVQFVSSIDERRMNLVVMGLVQVGAALALEGKRLMGELTPGGFRTEMNRLEVRREYPQPERIEDLGGDWRRLSLQLIDGALQVGRYCFVATEAPDRSFEFGLRYNIRGTTIARLVTAVECVLADAQGSHRNRIVDDVTTLIFCALKVSECRQELSRGCVHAALRLAAMDGDEPIRRAERVRAILHVGLDKVGDTHLLADLVTVLADALNQDPYLEESYTPLVDRIDQRIDDLKAERARKNSSQKTSSQKPPGGSGENGVGWFSRLLDERAKDPNM